MLVFLDRPVARRYKGHGLVCCGLRRAGTGRFWGAVLPGSFILRMAIPVVGGQIGAVAIVCNSEKDLHVPASFLRGQL